MASLVASALLLSLAPPSDALQLRAYTASRHDRFTGFPSSPVASATFIHNDVDLTGVGWLVGTTQPRSLTLISPKFFVGARHYRPSVGSTLRFVAADGTVRNYTVAANHDILNDDPPEQGGPQATDVSLGELVETVAESDGVSIQPYLNLPSEAAYLAAPYNQLIVLGKRARGGIGTSNAINDFFGTPVTSGGGINNTRTIEFVYQNLAGLVDDAYVESGDSGSPSLVNVGDRGALVGIHTAVLPLVATNTSIDSFVAHPPYISQMNTIMAAEGYHMTEAIPSSVSLTLAPTIPSVIRAGYPAELSVELSNADALNAANNLKLAYGLPVGSQGISAAGTQWVAETAGSSIAARKGGLAPATSTTITTTFTPLMPQSFNLSLQYKADEFSSTNQMVAIEIIESYLSWSTGLSDPSPTADIDFDGSSNLLEYAFGGDPETASLFQQDGVTALAPSVARVPNEDKFTFEFVRRKDAQARALEYVLQDSATLENASWSDASSDILETQTDSISADFERVTLTLAIVPGRGFYRIMVTLSEAA